MKILLTTLLLICTSYTNAQTNEIKIKFIGNAGLHMTDGNAHIYVDFPYKSGAYNYMEFEDYELDNIKHDSVFIFTHKHADHYSRKNVRKVLKKKNGKKFGPWDIDDMKKLSSMIPDFEVKAFETKHKVFGISSKHYSYLINWHGKKLYLSGDTTDAETVGKIKNIDWAFLPPWLLRDANNKKIKIDADKLYIYHLTTNQTPNAKEKWDDVSHIHPLVKQGEELKLAF